MRRRGVLFWAWADLTFHDRIHDEALDSGVVIDDQVRLTGAGDL